MQVAAAKAGAARSMTAVIGTAMGAAGALVHNYIETNDMIEVQNANIAISEERRRYQEKHAGRLEYSPDEIPMSIKTNRNRKSIPAHEVQGRFL